MKRMIGIGTALLLLLGTNAAFTQEPESEKEKKKPQQQETKKPEKPAEKEAPPKSQPPKSEPARSTPPKPAPSRQEPPPEKARPKSSDKARPKEEGKRDRSNTGAQASSEKTRHGGRRIPDPQFRRSFGREHTVRIDRGERRFQSNGFVFEVVEVWPEDWIFEDECYIDYIDDDYYLVDVVHPEHRIVVIVVEG